MSYLVLILMGFVLLKIAREDWKERAVTLYWFIALFLLLGWTEIDKVGTHAFVIRYFSNLLFIAVQLLLVNLYFCIKHRRFLWIFDRYLGWGDVIFWLAIAGAWELGMFFLFFIGSLILVLIFTALCLKEQKRNIPLAGLQALLFLACYLLTYFKLLPQVGVFAY